MLEYMLMRPLERPVFDMTRAWLEANPDEKFLLIVDEAHLYRGAAGAEVALLLRRLRSRLGITADRLQVICTSASFATPDYAREFAAHLSGKDVEDFRTVVAGLLADRSPAAPGHRSATPKRWPPCRCRSSTTPRPRPARLSAVRGFLEYRGVTPGPGDAAGALALRRARRLRADGPAGQRDHEAGRCRSANSGRSIFPDADGALADRAVSALVALGSAARRSPEDAGLLPCRVHAFFRGLPGLWACLDPDCPEVDAQAPGQCRARSGKLYAQPQAACACGARVFEFFTCRHCGSAYARAYTNDLDSPAFLWHEPGVPFAVGLRPGRSTNCPRSTCSWRTAVVRRASSSPNSTWSPGGSTRRNSAAESAASTSRGTGAGEAVKRDRR